MNNEIHSFSGTHAFNAEHAAVSVELDWIDQAGFTEVQVRSLAGKHAERVADALADGRCPRCGDNLDLENTAGSRLTICRCIPICPACGADEAYQPALGRPMSRVWEWPIGKGARTRRKNKIEAQSRPAVLTGDLVISEDGVSEVKLREHPGGWAEYGHDEEVDR